MDIKAIHESAHCISAIILETEFDRVTLEITAIKIIDNDNKSSSTIVTQPNIRSINFKNLTREQKIILALSGSVAEAILTKERMSNFPYNFPKILFTITDKTKEFLKRNTDDYKVYCENAESVSSFDEDINITIKLIKENWENVLIVAQYLEKNKSLTYDEVKEIILKKVKEK